MLAEEGLHFLGIVSGWHTGGDELADVGKCMSETRNTERDGRRKVGELRRDGTRP
jgi:hypothetical protein